MWVLSYLLMTALMFLGLFLIGLILLQRGRGGGLAGAFGGMGGQSAFGTKAGDVFTRITIGVAAAWILLCAGSVVALHHTSGGRADLNQFKKPDESGEVIKADPKDDAKDAVDLPLNTGATLPGTVVAPEKKAEEPKAGDAVKVETPAKTEPAPEAKKDDAPKAEEKKAEEKPAEDKKEEAKPAEEKKPEAPADKPAEPQPAAPATPENKPAEPKAEPQPETKPQ